MQNHVRNLSIYLHIPFCRARCTYCAFNTYTDRFALVGAYVDALCHEIGQLGRGESVHTVYFGGGTPSLLSTDQLKTIIDALQKAFHLSEEVEITLEANPGTAIDWLGLRELGINRLSIGMQSALAHELTLFARDHTLDEVGLAVERARKAGFDNISLDLIYGIPKQSLQDWETSLDTALAYQPQHVSLYALGLEPGTELTRWVKYGQLPQPDEDLAADMYDLATEKLADLQQYEISNWGKPSQHNMQYWRNLPYLGLGAGAHGYVAHTRTVNVMRPEVYIERLQQSAGDYPSTGATQSAEVVNRDQEIFETIMMNLRLLQEGLSRQAYEARFGEPIDGRFGEVIAQLVAEGLLTEREGHIVLAPSARLISNRVFQAFL